MESTEKKTPMNLIDSHAHLTYGENKDIERILSSAKNSGISKIINVCTSSEELEEGIDLSNRHPFIFNAAAITPHDVEKDQSLFFKNIQNYAKAKTIVAIGETGLDYYYHQATKKLQKDYFSRQILLAKESSLPLIIHCRESFSDLFEIADKYLPFAAVLHCFTGTLDDMKKTLDRGWFLSFSGIITYNNSLDLQEVVSKAPLEKMLIETDSPFLAPQKYRGKKNQPAFLIETAKKIAEIKKISLEMVATTSSQNANSFFNL